MTTSDEIAVAAVVVTVAGLVLSIIALVISIRTARSERRHATRSQLNEVLRQMAAVMIERQKLQHENQNNDPGYVQRLSPAFDQQQSFLLQQARYLADQIPDLVGSVEWTALGYFNALGNDLIAAEGYYRRAAEVAPDPASRLASSGAFAWFLFTQRRFEEAREVYTRALTQRTGSDNFVRYQRGKAYLFWACNERDWASAPQRAVDAFEAVANEFRGIDIEALRLSALQELEAAKNPMTVPPQPALTPKGT